MKYRPSKFLFPILIPLIVVTIALTIGMLPDVKDYEVRPVPGEITFKNRNPKPANSTQVSMIGGMSLRSVFDFIEESFDDLMSWEFNPWKRPEFGFGDKYFKMVSSKDPLDRARAMELQRLAKSWHQRLLVRFPELAVQMKQVPDDQNGFLKWLEFKERYQSALKDGESAALRFPQALDDYLNKQGPWDADAAQSWLTENANLLEEIRAIGLMPEASVNGIAIDRWGFIDARFARDCQQALMLDATLAGKQGDADAALESIRAAKGLADHFTQIETPSLLGATVQILLQLDIEQRVMNDILPALPQGAADPSEWESAVNPTAHSPAEFGRLMKGEWSISMQYFLLPMLLDSADPHLPPDPGELLDDFALSYINLIRHHEAATLHDLHLLDIPEMQVNTSLSRQSQKATENFFIGSRAWRKGWEQTQSRSALTQAAFAIMKGQAIPKDPVFGQDYLWDPSTRQLSMPANKAFEEMDIQPIIVPNP